MQTLSHSSKGCVLKMDDGRTITVQEDQHSQNEAYALPAEESPLQM